MKQNQGDNMQYLVSLNIPKTIQIFIFPEILLGSIQDGVFTPKDGAIIRDNDRANIAAIIEREYALEPQEPRQSLIKSELEEAKENLCKRQEEQALMKNANAIIRKYKTAETCTPLLIELGLKETEVHRLLNPRYSYEKQGYQGWQLTNNNANITRLLERVQILEKKEEKREEIAAAENTEQPEEVVNGVTIRKDYEADRIQLFFDGKPTDKIRTSLKGNGWRWAPSVGAWSRKLTRQAEYDALYICKQVEPVTA